jgi:hypothetical protein
MIDYDRITQHDINLQRLVTDLLKNEVFRTWDEAYREIRLIMLDQGLITSKKQLDDVLKAVSGAVDNPVRATWDNVMMQLETAAVYEAEFQAAFYGSIASAYGYTVAMTADDKTLNYITKAVMSLDSGNGASTGTVSDQVKSLIASQGKLVRDQIISGYINRKPTPEIIKSLGTVTHGKIKCDNEALARTAMSFLANSATDYFAQENSDFIQWRVYSATLDRRTTLFCAENDRKRWEISRKDYPRLPAHWRCRSRYVFLVKGQDQLDSTRASYEGQVDANTNYEQFLRRQSKEFIYDVLGKARGDVFINNNLRLSNFLDLTGRVLTLDELKQRDILT